MSGVEQMRLSAALMRGRALRALEDIPEQRWIARPAHDPNNNGWEVASDIPDADGWDTTLARLTYDYEGHTSPHIASWHPVVAMAVADWLEKQADMSDSGNGIPAMSGRGYEQALAVARAYLGKSST